MSKNITDLNAKGGNRAEPFQVRKPPYANGKSDDCFATLKWAEDHRDEIVDSLALLKDHRKIFADDHSNFKAAMSSNDFLRLSEPALKGKICMAVLKVLSPITLADIEAQETGSDFVTMRELIDWDIERKIKEKRTEFEQRTGESPDWKKERTLWEKSSHHYALVWLAQSQLGDLHLDQVTPIIIEQVRDAKESPPKALNTMIAYLGGSWTRFVKAHRVYLTNPVAMVIELPETEAIATKSFTWQQADAVINKLWEIEVGFRKYAAGRCGAFFTLLAVCIELIAHTGMRRIDCLDLRAGQLQDIEGDDPMISRVMIKTKKMTHVFLTPRAVELVKMLTQRSEDMTGKKLADDQCLFTKTDGERLPLVSADNNAPFQKRYVPVLKELGVFLPGQKSTHRFRAFAATELFNCGRSYDQIGAQLGIDARTAEGYVTEQLAADSRKGSKKALAQLNKKRGRKAITHTLPRERHLRAVS